MTGKHNEIILKGRLNGSQRNKVKRLLNMLYTPLELSEEIGVSKQQIYRVYIPLGCPYTKDRIGHILINGKDFKAWVIDIYKNKKLNANQAYCVSCKKIVKIIDPKINNKGNLIYQQSECPLCGNNVTRIISCKRKGNDKQGELEAH
ncbi:MAG: hypothetical protein P9L97_00245 [Candidatus Tenebribacter davisii]|nr:hypothetical protein [Candidatus Tenebribacter davisii]